MVLKVIGEGCDKCDNLYKHTVEAVQQLSLEVEIEKVENLLDIVKLGVMSTPSLMADGKLLVSGQDVSTKKIVKLLQKL